MTVENLQILAEQWEATAANEEMSPTVRDRAAENARLARERINAKIAKHSKYSHLGKEVKPRVKK